MERVDRVFGKVRLPIVVAGITKSVKEEVALSQKAPLNVALVAVVTHV